MKLDPTRQDLKPFLGFERRELLAGFLYAIIASIAIVVSFVFLMHQMKLGGIIDTTSFFLIALLITQFILFALLRRGYLNQTAVILVFSTWLGVSDQAWQSDGVHDVVIYAYILTILMAARCLRTGRSPLSFLC